MDGKKGQPTVPPERAMWFQAPPQSFDLTDPQAGYPRGYISIPYEIAVTSPDYHREGEDALDGYKKEMDAYMRKAYSQMLDGLEDDNVIHHWSATGRDVEFRNSGIIGGTWCGSRHDEDQLWTNRPIPELARYRTPIDGLYHAHQTSGHPGGLCLMAIPVSADGKLPGYVFKLNGPAEIKLEAKLDFMDPIRSVEIIQNGRVVRQLSWEEFKSKGLGRLAVEDSGCFVVRATADVEHTYRFAMTGPYYVEMAGQGPFVREESAKFFLDWVGQRAESIKLEDARKRKEVLAYHEYAIRWWQKKLEQAKKK